MAASARCLALLLTALLAMAPPARAERAPSSSRPRLALDLTSETVSALQQDARVTRPVVGLDAELRWPLGRHSPWGLCALGGVGRGGTRQQLVVVGYPGVAGVEKRLWMRTWDAALLIDHATPLPGGAALEVAFGYRYRAAQSHYRAPSVQPVSPGVYEAVYTDLYGARTDTHGVMARLGASAPLTSHLGMRVSLSACAGVMHGRDDVLEVTEADEGVRASAGLTLVVPGWD